MVEDSLRTLKLMNETGFPIHQDNGQRIYGPPPNWEGPAPKDTEVFIGKLPNDIYEYDMVPLFSSVGDIYMIRIMQNFSGLNRGFAFVQYTTSEGAERAIRFLNNVEIRPGEKIGVVKSRNNCRLYIGRLDTTMTQEDIRKELEKYTEDIVDVIIHKSDIPGHHNRGYAFVEYLTHKAAAKARRKIVPCKIKIRGVEVTVDWATPINESGENINVPNSILIKNIRESVTNDELYHFISLHNNFKITKFKRLPNQVLISFYLKNEAEFAMRILNELKDSKQFSYLEDNKKIEIVWLKNNTDLSEFSSSVNYVPPKNFNFALKTCCDPSYHQHHSVDLEMQKQQLIDRINQSNQQKLNNIKQQTKMMKQCSSNLKFPVMDNIGFCNNNGRSVKPLHSNGNTNIQNQMQAFSPNLNNYHQTVNTLTNRLTNARNNYQMESNFNLANRMQFTNRTNTLASFNLKSVNNLQSGFITPQNHLNPFTAMQNDNQINSYNTWNANNGLPANVLSNINLINSNNLAPPGNQSLNPLVNSLNTSYNFSIWKNCGTNLDASANWSKLNKDRQQ